MGEPRRDGPGPPGLLPVPLLDHRAVGRPGLRAFTDGTAARRRPGPQRPAPRPLVAHQRRPRRARQRGRRARHPGRRRRRQGPAAAGPDVPRRHRRRADRLRRGGQGRAGRRAALRRLAARRPGAPARSCPTAGTSRPSHESVVRRQQLFGYTEEELRVLVTPMAASGAEPIGSMGTDTPVAALSARLAAALRLLQPAVRPGHQPAAGRHPRGARDQPGPHLRPRAEPARAHPGVLPAGVPAVPGHRQRRAGQDPAHQRRRRPARLRRRPDHRPVRRHRRRAGAGRGDRALRTEVSKAIAAGARIIMLSDRDSDEKRAPIPSLLHDLRRAPPPGAGEDPHAGRPGRRVRRLPRGAPRRAAARLRRGRGQPLPGVRDRRGPVPPRHARPTSSPRRPSATSSTRWARACSR